MGRAQPSVDDEKLAGPRYGAHVSLIGHITADELRRYLTATETANGFGNRFLWICADRSKLLPEGGTVDAAAMDAHRDELAGALAFARTAGEIHRDDEARAVWCSVYGELSEGKPGLAGAAWPAARPTSCGWRCCMP